MCKIPISKQLSDFLLKEYNCNLDCINDSIFDNIILKHIQDFPSDLLSEIGSMFFNFFFTVFKDSKQYLPYFADVKIVLRSITSKLNYINYFKDYDNHYYDFDSLHNQIVYTSVKMSNDKYIHLLPDIYQDKYKVLNKLIK